MVTDGELAEVATAFQPHSAEELIQLLERGDGPHRQLHPVETAVKSTFNKPVRGK